MSTKTKEKERPTGSGNAGGFESKEFDGADPELMAKLAELKKDASKGPKPRLAHRTARTIFDLLRGACDCFEDKGDF